MVLCLPPSMNNNEALETGWSRNNVREQRCFVRQFRPRNKTLRSTTKRRTKQDSHKHVGTKHGTKHHAHPEQNIEPIVLIGIAPNKTSNKTPSLQARTKQRPNKTRIRTKIRNKTHLFTNAEHVRYVLPNKGPEQCRTLFPS